VIIEWDSAGHNGGDMAFGADGMMYVGSGDGTSDSDEDRKGQDLTSLRSKILRIDVDHPDDDLAADGRHYSVPRDNPMLIAPGHPERSVLLARMGRRGPGQMPQLATSILDDRAVALVRQWIESLEP